MNTKIHFKIYMKSLKYLKSSYLLTISLEKIIKIGKSK